MLKHAHVFTKISSPLDDRNGFILSHLLLYEVKNHFVFAWQTELHMFKVIFVQTGPKRLAFENRSQQFQTIMLRILFSFLCYRSGAIFPVTPGCVTSISNMQYRRSTILGVIEPNFLGLESFPRI